VRVCQEAGVFGECPPGYGASRADTTGVLPRWLLVAWVDEQKATGGRVQHLVFVVDEMGSFIGDSGDKISEVNSLAEMIGNKGKGKVWMICTRELLAGFIGSKLVNQRGEGLILDIILGIVGAVAGGFVFRALARLAAVAAFVTEHRTSPYR